MFTVLVRQVSFSDAFDDHLTAKLDLGIFGLGEGFPDEREDIGPHLDELLDGFLSNRKLRTGELGNQRLGLFGLVWSEVCTNNY